MKSNLTEKEQLINKRLDEMNHAPYFELVLVFSLIFLLFVFIVLIGVF